MQIKDLGEFKVIDLLQSITAQRSTVPIYVTCMYAPGRRVPRHLVQVGWQAGAARLGGWRFGAAALLAGACGVCPVFPVRLVHSQYTYVGVRVVVVVVGSV